MRVTVYYSALASVLTDEARVQTDNSAYSLVALTFDDGPSYTPTARLLNNLRHTGAVGTFFLVGSRIDEYMDVAMRENDETTACKAITMCTPIPKNPRRSASAITRSGYTIKSPPSQASRPS